MAKRRAKQAEMTMKIFIVPSSVLNDLGISPVIVVAQLGRFFDAASPMHPDHCMPLLEMPVL